MLYNLLQPLAEEYQFFNLFNYLSFRTIGAIFTSMLLSFLIFPRLIKKLAIIQSGSSTIREDTPENHLLKEGTPTMGGVMILISLLLSSFLWMDLNNHFFWILMFVTLGFGIVGFIDDYAKLKNSSKGISGRLRLLIQFCISIIAVAYYKNITGDDYSSSISVPFIKDFFIDLGIFFIPFAAFVIVGSGNAVNLTDGLDGLAIVPVMIAGMCFGIFAYLIGNINFANYLNLLYIKGTGELIVFCAALIGSGIGFLWFNAPPAMIFMGDTGSLSLGAALGIISVIIKEEILLVLIGGLFVLEALSVIAQVLSFKLTGKRIFRMAPVHHHYEKKGWAESTIVIRFWIVALLLALIALSSLKIR